MKIYKLSFIYSTQEDVGLPLSDREQAMAWALATFFRQVGIPKTSPNSAILERVQSFIMKDKRSLKFPGSRSSRAKVPNSFFLLAYW